MGVCVWVDEVKFVVRDLVGGGSGWKGERGVEVVVVWLVVVQKQSEEGVQSFLDSLPPSVRENVQNLRNLQKRCDTLKMEFTNEKRRLEEKYRALYGGCRIVFYVQQVGVRCVWGVYCTVHLALEVFWNRVFVDGCGCSSCFHRTCPNNCKRHQGEWTDWWTW